MNAPDARLPTPASVDVATADDDTDVARWLDAALAPAWPVPPEAEAHAPAVRERLQRRMSASRAAEAMMVTTRLRRARVSALADGVTARTLYAAQAGSALRPGEPQRVRLFELAAGARLDPAIWGDDTTLRARHREWLVLAGDITLGSVTLAARDYHVTPAGHATPACASTQGARVFLRESDAAARAGDTSLTVRDADGGWPDYAAGIQRRVLWQRDGQAALLYRAQPGAQVPHHSHGHDEECLMVQGELFLDDVLLQAGDYQLAPAGSAHQTTSTDTGVIIYAHGDLDLRFVD